MKLFTQLQYLAASLVLVLLSAAAAAQQTGDCAAPPFSTCARTGCEPAHLAEPGNAVDALTERKFFLDYPCDLQPGEKITFILSTHGAGSIANWQRHYFPAFDYKEKYRLVIATPSALTAAPLRMWTSEADDAHLQNISEQVFERFGRENIAAFWLAGHSQGGMTSNRIVCTPYFRDKVDGWLSLSGGRIGRAEIAPDFFGPNGPPAALNASGGENGPRPGIATTPDCDISHIFTSGELEITALPDSSPWAEKYHCAARVQLENIVDTEKGYVTGASEGRPASWGRAARPGTAEVFVYPACDENKLVADVLRLDKGHTEGLEPRVTEALIRMLVAAPGGKAQQKE